ncbi:MAG TPA: 2Fe-2S iron-sulfur cluster binding domain-containing protein [Candidatus Coprovivens excrementavium]|nr:2Fe-2S iron-sulfur cluster binding domain-containing protein [Candidatus Coprovivens excrementavium]
MEKLKIKSLGIFDEQKFKKIGEERNNWLESGSDMILNNNSSKIKEMKDSITPSRIIVSVKKVLKENENYKTIVLTNQNDTKLPLFRAGQKIAITVNVDGVYYTKAYSISSSPARALMNEYCITIRNSNEVVDHYLYENIKINEKFAISSPFGDFYYEPLRDEKNIIAIVSDEGIIPVYSMVQAVIDGSENYNITLFYSAKNESDLLFLDELKTYDSNSSKVRVIIVLSEEEKDGYLTGFVSSDKIKTSFREGETSFFIAGSEGLLKYLDKELEEFKLPKKFIRYNSYLPTCNIKRIVKYNLGVYIGEEKFDIPCYNNKTILTALEEGGIYIPSKCRDGSCGFCRSELVKGEVKVINDKRVNVDKKYNYIHPCSTYPMSDIEIIVR